MGRKKVLEGGTKDKIVKAAIQVFMENGYENTSVRTILEKADVVTGSFYHFFASKEELFEEVIGQYLRWYETKVIEVTGNEAISFLQKIDLILNIAEESTGFYYQKLEAQRLHWTIQYALHKKTIMAILPEVEKLVDKEIQEERALNPLQMDSNTLAIVLLQGMEGIIHAKPVEKMDDNQFSKEHIAQMKRDIIAYVTMIMGLKKE